MNQERELRAFLSRQKSVWYCLQCLFETGMFRRPEPEGYQNVCCEMIDLASSSINSFPTALMLERGHCRICLARRICIVFPGRAVQPKECIESQSMAYNLTWMVTISTGSSCWTVI